MCFSCTAAILMNTTFVINLLTAESVMARVKYTLTYTPPCRARCSSDLLKPISLYYLAGDLMQSQHGKWCRPHHWAVFGLQTSDPPSRSGSCCLDCCNQCTHHQFENCMSAHNGQPIGKWRFSWSSKMAKCHFLSKTSSSPVWHKRMFEKWPSHAS